MTKKGRKFVRAKWREIQQECADGSIKYEPPSGDSFELPLDSCLYVDLDDHITIRRRYAHLDADGVELLEQEAASLV